MFRNGRLPFLVLVIWAVALLAISSCAPAAAPPAPAPTKGAAPAASPPPQVGTAAATAKPAAAPATPTPAPPAVKVRFASPGFVSDAGVFIAFDKGYFKQEGIDLELVTLKTAADAPPLLARGDIEVAGGSTSAALYNAIVRGIDMRIVADKGVHPKGLGWQVVAVRKDLAGQVKTPADLKGRKIALSCNSCSVDYFLMVVLKQANLNIKDVDTVDMAVPDMLAAFGNKSIDAGVLVEPNATTASEQGLAVSWITIDQVDPGNQAAVIIMSPTFASNVDVARRFIVAYVKGLRDYNDAFVKNKGKAETISILTKYTSVKDAAQYQKVVLAALNPDGAMNIESLAQQQEFFIERGGMTSRVDLKKAIDTQFVEYAVQKLGKY